MKTMKKIFALTLALMLVFSLALTANAANLNVDGALKGAKYEIYKIADVTKETSGAVVYTAVAEWVDFLEDLTWIDFFEGETSTKFVRKGNPSEADMITAAKAAKAYAAENNIPSTDSETADESSNASFTNVADGYYLMTSDKGSLCTLATITAEDTQITEKNAALPKIKKTVNDANVAIGDTVTFTLTITTGENHSNEINYIIHDTMSDGLTLNQNSIVVKYKDSANANEKTLVLNNDYTIRVPGAENDAANKCTFEIHFTETLNTKANGIMTVTYTADVNATANDTETNTATIEDSSDSVTVTTTEFTLNKKDGEGNSLAGAKFKLYYATTAGAGESMTTTYTEVPVIKDGDNYRPAVDPETGVEIEAGTATVKGLDPDVIYYVKETVAPTGYVKIDDYKIVENGTVTVVNVKGEELPSTGGMGTTMFYIMGGLMVAAAVVLLVSKKRMSAM